MKTIISLFFLAFTLTLSSQTYICYKNDKNSSMEISIAFDKKGNALNIKYKGQSESIPLKFVKQKNSKGGAHPSDETYYDEIYKGKKNGSYKLTHSGIWDYVEYTRGKDGKKFNFTINHETSVQGESYRTTPCF